MRGFVTLLIVLFAAMPARSAEIAIALTDERVEVDASFAGATLTLFGAVTGVEDPKTNIDIISVIRGPSTNFTIRKLEKKRLIWMPGDAHSIENAPGLYLTNSTKAISDVAPLPDQALHRLGADFLNVRASRPSEGEYSSEHNQLFTNAFLTEAEDKGLYQDRVGGVEFAKGALFRIKVELPAFTPVGDYSVAVFLYQDGVLLGKDSASLVVNKVGLERRIYELAHNHPLSYGLICVVLSLLAGWGASLAFRK